MESTEDKNVEKNATTSEVNDVENADLEINNGSETIYPNAKVKIDKAQFSILHLQTLCSKRKELILDPDFQRNEVWKNKQKSELIESILMGIPIPLMYLFEDKNGKKQVVDGRQRISAILEFLEGHIKLTGLKILSNLNGSFFNDLDTKLQGIFEDYQLFFYIIQPPTPERVKYDIFDRVNRGGTSLNKQEMRNALYRGKSTDLLNRLCDSSEFIIATGSINKVRMKDQYVALRAFAFLMLQRGVFNNIESLEYKGDIDDFLARFMIYINEDDMLINEYEKKFKSSMEFCFEVLGENAFRFASESVQRRPINMPLLEALTYLFSFPLDLNKKVEMAEAIDLLKKEFDNSAYFSGNIDSTTSVTYRFDKIDELATTFRYDKEYKN